MRGAYYVVTALLVVASSRTAAESDQSQQLRTNNYDIVAVSNVVGTERLSRDVHDDVAPTAADEERMNPASITKMTESVAANAALLDAEKNFLPQAAMEGVRSQLFPGNTALRFDVPQGRLHNERFEPPLQKWGEGFLLQHPIKGESHAVRQEVHAAGQPDILRRQNYRRSSVGGLTNRQEGAQTVRGLPEEGATGFQRHQLGSAAVNVYTPNIQSSHTWIGLPLQKWQQLIKIQFMRSSKSPVIQRVPGQPNTLSDTNNLLRTIEGQTKRQKGAQEMNFSLKEVKSELQFNPPEDYAAYAADHHSRLRNERTEPTLDEDGEGFVLQPSTSRTSPVFRQHTHGAGQPETSLKRKHVLSAVEEQAQKHEELHSIKSLPEYKAIRDTFSKLGGPPYNPTNKEIHVLVSMMRLEDIKGENADKVRMQLQIQAAKDVASSFVALFSQRQKSVELIPYTFSELHNIWDYSLNVRFQRLMKVYEIVHPAQSGLNAMKSTTKAILPELGESKARGLIHSLTFGAPV